MRKIRPYYVIITMMIILFSVAEPVQAARPTTVDVKASEKAGAGIVDRVELYAASYALVIGNDKYQHWPTLQEAERDARKVAAELTKHGFEVDLQFNLDAAALRGKLRNFFAKKGQTPDSRLLLWFAGHGHTLDGEGYLVPIDAVANGASPNFLTTALPMRDFGSLVRLAKSKHVLSVFDSCFSGTIFRTRAGAVPNAITRKTLKAVRQFITSGDAGQQVRDDGSFRTLFLRALRGEARADFNKDGYLTGEELGLFLNQEMSSLTKDAQTPKAGKLHDVKYNEGDFVFFLPRQASTTLAEASISTAPKRMRGLSLDALKKQQQLRDQWAVWQQAMQQDFDVTQQAARTLDQDLQHQAWQQFLDNFPDDNPLSQQDEALRQQATARRDAVKKTSTFKVSQQHIVPATVGVKPALAASRAGEERTFDGMRFVWIPPGEFMMGSNEYSGEQPVHKVKIQKGFWLGKYEVTQAQWQAVMGNNPSRFRGDDRPVEQVSWNDVQVYLGKLGSRYRLPTEAEWEYGARAGTTTAYSWGNRTSHEYANYGKRECCGGLAKGKDRWEYTSPVGSFAANPWGVYDMHGNVWEWTQDCWNASYQQAPKDGSAWLSGYCKRRVLRGGSWYLKPEFLRAANRYRNYTDNRYDSVGFRVVYSRSSVQD